MARRLFQIVLGTVLLVLLVAGGAVAWLAWYPDSVKAPLERLLSAQLGQRVRIEGPMHFAPGRVTTVELQGLHIAAPEWARAHDLAAVDRLRVGADILAWLRRGDIQVTELTLAAPRLDLERDAQGRTSWPTSEGRGKSAGGGLPQVSLGRVEISDGRLALQDAASGTEVTASLATAPQTGAETGLRLEGRGTVRGDPLAFGLQLGSVQQAATGMGALAVDGTLTLPGTRLEVAGRVDRLAPLAGIDLRLNLASDDPTAVLALAGWPVAAPPPLLSASLRLSGDRRWMVVEPLQARWGESAVDGRLTVDLRGPKPRVDGRMHAGLLDLPALLPAAQSSGGAPATPKPIGNPLQSLAGYRGKIELVADEIRLPSQVTLRDTTVTLDLADDRLTMPLRVGLPEGELAGELVAAPLKAPELTVDTRLTATGVGLAGLAGDGFAGVVDGRLEGMAFVGAPQAILQRSRLRFEGRGHDLAIPQALLGSFDLTAVLEDGRLRLDPLVAELPQGELSGRVAAGPFDADFAADIDLAAKGIDLGAITRVSGVAGRLDGRVNGTVRGAEPLDMLTCSRIALVGTIAGLQLPVVEQRIAKADIDASLDPDRREALRLVARAAAGERSLNVTAFGGSFGTLAENRGDYPFTIVSDLGKNEVEVNGTITLPLAERRFTATLSAEGPDPSPVLALLDLPKLQVPPYRLRGRVTNRGDELRISDFDGRVGDSDVTTDLTVNFDGERPKISGTMRSRMLDADDLGGLVGVAPATGAGETASPGQVQEAAQIGTRTQVLPNERIDPARWRRVDLDLAVRAEEIRAGKVPLDGFSGQVTMDDGLLRIEEMDLVIGEGHLTGRIEADGRRSPVGGDVALDLQRVSVARLLSRLDVDAAAFGTLSGQARGGVGLGGEGHSIKEILARSNGQVRLMMEGGQIDRTIVAALGLDLLRLVGAATGASPDTVEMRCALADLEIRDGIVATDPLVIDTEIAHLGGRGTVNLKSEVIDVSLTARPKETPLLTDLTGISIDGRLGAPEIAINPAAVVARGVAAATLGMVLKPFTAMAGAGVGATPPGCAALLERQGDEPRPGG